MDVYEIKKLNKITNLIKVHEFSSAEKEINELLSTSTGEFKYLLDLRQAKIYYLSKRHDEAIKITDRLEKDPGTDKQPDQLYLVRGEIYFGTGKYKEALTNFKKAISFRRSPYILYRVAECSYNLCDYSQALYTIQEVMKNSKSPTDKNNLHLLALIYKKLKRFKEAEDVYRKLLQINPNDQTAYSALLSINLKKEDLINKKSIWYAGKGIKKFF